MSNKTDVLSFDSLKKFAISDILSVSGKDKTSRVIEKHMNNLIEVALIRGKQSKQSEVDELQKRIDEISNHVEINYDENRGDDSHSYWSGYNQALRELFEILKGEET